MLGLPIAELLACAGAPHRQAAIGTHTFLTYESTDIVEIAQPLRSPFFSDWRRDRNRWMERPLYDVRRQQFQCATTATVENGRVVRVEHAGPAEGVCRFTATTCLGLAGRP